MMYNYETVLEKLENVKRLESAKTALDSVVDSIGGFAISGLAEPLQTAKNALDEALKNDIKYLQEISVNAKFFTRGEIREKIVDGEITFKVDGSHFADELDFSYTFNSQYAEFDYTIAITFLKGLDSVVDLVTDNLNGDLWEMVQSFKNSNRY